LPSTLVSDFALDAVYPHTAVTIFSNLLRSIPEERLKIRAVAPQLPRNFYEKYETDNRARHAILNEYGLEAVMEEVREADIFVLGAGTAADPSYQKVHQALHVKVGSISSEPENTPEILYTPIDTDGTEDEATERKIIGIKISECRRIKDDPKRYVIVVAGGREKRISLQSAFKKPCFNILVTDADAAEEAVKRGNEFGPE
jgi:DNA-binding transcriptional regulator LsrR (DeoR family)